MQIGFIRRIAVHLDQNDQVKEAQILEFVGERNYIANHRDSLALWYIERKPWQGFVLNLDITHQFLSEQQARTEKESCNEGGMITEIEYIETSEEGICIEKTTYLYGFNELGQAITCTDSENTICPVGIISPGNGSGIGNPGGNPGGNPVGFPVTGGIAVGPNPWSGWGLGSDYGGGIGGIPIYVHDPSNGQYPIDPGNNADPKNGGGPIGQDVPSTCHSCHPKLKAIFNTDFEGLVPGSLQFLSGRETTQLDKVFREIYENSPLFRSMIDEFINANKKIYFGINPNLPLIGAGGEYSNGIISFANIQSINKDTVFEELYHAFQEKYAQDTNDPLYFNNTDGIGGSNVEFEPKFVRDFIANRIFYNSSQEDFIFQINTHKLGENYDDWIKNLAAMGHSLVIDSTYYAFVEQFGNQYAGIDSFYSEPMIPNMPPKAFLYLLSICNCTFKTLP